MQTFNIREAKAQLSKLVDMAASGKSFIIAKAGKPMVRVVAINYPESSQIKRIGFLAGQFTVPDNFNSMGQEEIQKLFEGE